MIVGFLSGSFDREVLAVVQGVDRNGLRFMGVV